VDRSRCRRNRRLCRLEPKVRGKLEEARASNRVLDDAQTARRRYRRRWIEIRIERDVVIRRIEVRMIEEVVPFRADAQAVTLGQLKLLARMASMRTPKGPRKRCVRCCRTPIRRCHRRERRTVPASSNCGAKAAGSRTGLPAFTPVVPCNWADFAVAPGANGTIDW